MLLSVLPDIEYASIGTLNAKIAQYMYCQSFMSKANMLELLLHRSSSADFFQGVHVSVTAY